MASAVKICNMALSHVGASARVSSISPPDGSVEAGHCETFYDVARTEMLEPGNFAFSLDRAFLAEVTNLSDNWAYAYTKPSDCLRPLRIVTAGAGITVFNQDEVELQVDDSDSAAFSVEGDTLFSNEPDAILVYVRDVTDTTKFTPSFVSAFSYLLSSYLAGPILKGTTGMKVGDGLRTRALQIASASATASANASSTTSAGTPSSIAARQ